MELGEFRKDPVASILERGFVEARLHTDGDNNRECILELQERYVGDPSLPNYVIVDPDDLKVRGRFEGAYLDAARRRQFVEFLEKGLAAVRGA